MVRYTIRNGVELEEFAKKHIPADCTVRIPDKKELPLENPKEGETGVYALFFVQAGFTLPLDPLLHRFMWDTGLSLGQISPNAMRVIMGCSALNRILNINLTPREIFYCYMFCKCPGEDSHGLYLRARRNMPDLVKCLINSEKDFQKDVLCIGGNWRGTDPDGTPRVGIYARINRSHASPKQTPSNEVDFEAINKVLKYNGEFFRVQSRHLRAAHNLLGYTPLDTNWLPERRNQPTELGPKTRKSSKSKGKGKKKASSSAQTKRASEPAVADRIVLGPPGAITATGRFEVESEVVGVSLVQSRNKGTVVEISPDVSGAEDSEKTNSEQEVDDWVEETFEYLRSMPIQKRSLMGGAPPDATSGSQQFPSSTSVSQEKDLSAPDKTPSPQIQRQRKRKRNLTLRDDSASPPPINVDPVDTVVGTPSDNQQQLVVVDHTNSPAATQSSEEWHPTFELKGRPLRISDTPFSSPAVAVSLIAGTTKFEDVERESKKSMTKLRDEMLQDLVVGSQRAAILDNKRLEQIKKYSDLLKAKDEDLKTLREDLSQKKKDNNSLTKGNQQLGGQVKELQQKLDDALKTLTSKDQDMSDLKVQHAKKLEDLDAQHSSELEELKKKHSSELDEAEQKGYDTGFEELSAELEVIKGVCYQVGYNLGLDTLGAPANSEHRRPISLPANFQVRDHLPTSNQPSAIPDALTSDAPPSEQEVSTGGDAQTGTLEDLSIQQPLAQDPAAQQPQAQDPAAPQA